MKKSTASDFSRKEIHSIATRYSNDKYSFVEFFSEYECSKQVFNEILETAIVHCIVSQKVALSIYEVSRKYSFVEFLDIPFSIFRSVEEMFELEEEVYCKLVDLVHKSKFYKLSKQDAIYLIVTFASSPLSKKEFCSEYPYSIDLLERTIKDSILYGWITLDTVESLRQKAYQYENAGRVNKIFSSLLSLRSKMSEN